MPSIKTKVGISVISAGTLGGMGYGIDALINTDSLENYLQNNEFFPIDEDDSDEWERIYQSYQLEKTGFEIEEKIDNAEAIKKWCKSGLKQNIKSTSDPLFQKASRWCTSITTIEEVLSEQSFEAEPAQLLLKYNELEPEIKELVDKETVESTNSNPNATKLKKWCDTNKKRRFTENNEEEFFLTNIRKSCLKVSGDRTISSGSVKSFLQSKGLEITQHDATTEWDKAFETYKVEATTSDLKIKSGALNNKEELRDWCVTALDKTINSEASEDYKKASHWCVKFETIKEKLDAQGKTNIDSAENLNGKYSSLPQKLRNQIDSVIVTPSQQKHEKGEKIKKWCEDNRKRRSNDSNSSLLDQISKHCFAN